MEGEPKMNRKLKMDWIDSKGKFKMVWNELITY